jgi:hypothetical protein
MIVSVEIFAFIFGFEESTKKKISSQSRRLSLLPVY